MRRISSSSYLLLIAILGFAGCASGPEMRLAVPRPPLTADQLTGEWIGYDQDSLLFYRFSLEDNSRGSCVVLYEDDFSGAYMIENWEVSGRSMKLKLVPRTDNAEKLTLSVLFVDENKLHILVRGQERNWEHSLLMHREDRTLANIRKCAEMNRSLFKR